MGSLLSALFWFICIFCMQCAYGEEAFFNRDHKDSREGDPAGIVENVSVIYGDYSEVELDLIVEGPDPLIVSRYYTSRDSLLMTNLGGWRFYSYCYLFISKEPSIENNLSAYIGTSLGSTLHYEKNRNRIEVESATLFKVNADLKNIGIANNARGEINAWTNQKNNSLYFFQENDCFELILCNGGKRIYKKHSNIEPYLLDYEIFPSGNKVFYSYDDQGRVVHVQLTNASEQKVLSWIKFNYNETLCVEASNGKRIEYSFDLHPSGQMLLTHVEKKDSPSINYEYEIYKGRALVIRKMLPAGRFIEIKYTDDEDRRVSTIKVLDSIDRISAIQFNYFLNEDGNNFTEVCGPIRDRSIYRYEKRFQLLAVEQYLEGSLYRIQRKRWGVESNAGNLMSTSVEDSNGNTWYYQDFSYDEQGNILHQLEFGNLTGANANPIVLDENDSPVQGQECHSKSYTYSKTKNSDVVEQRDVKKSGLRFEYKKDTSILLRKYVLEKGTIRKRTFYEYNDDGVLIRTVIDDGGSSDPSSLAGVHERYSTCITPKQTIPNLGAAETIVETCFGSDKKTGLIKKIVNHFDSKGRVITQDFFDDHEDYVYSIKREYNESGCLIRESNPLGNETQYSYDENFLCLSKYLPAKGLTILYTYDRLNRIVREEQRDNEGNSLTKKNLYDAMGNVQSTVDSFGNETKFTYDSLGRLVSISYPDTKDESQNSIHPVRTYAYDIFDHCILEKDPKGDTKATNYTVRGSPTQILDFDGGSEFFKYDSEGTLHRYKGRTGSTEVYEYDYIGRITHISQYPKGDQPNEELAINKYYSYDAFHLISDTDDSGIKTNYLYNNKGLLSSMNKTNKKIDFFYDSLGRLLKVKKWQTKEDYILQTTRRDLVGNLTEECIENEAGVVLGKRKAVYDPTGRIVQIIGYPENIETTLVRYEYDAFNRITKTTDALENSTEFTYGHSQQNSRLSIDSLGNQTEELLDFLNKPIKISKWDSRGVNLTQTDFFYDEIGNKILEKHAIVSRGEVLGTYANQWNYEKGTQLASRVDSPDSEQKQTTSYIYGSMARLNFKCIPGSKDPISYRYNKRGLPSFISYNEDDSSEPTEYRMDYDDKQNLLSIRRNDNGLVSYSYNEHGQPIHENFQDGFGVYKISCSYNRNGQIQKIVLPDESFIEYSYEGPYVKCVSRFNKKKKELYSHQFVERDLMGNLLREILPGTVGERKHRWNRLSHLTEITTDFYDDKIPEEGFDSLLRITKRQKSVAGEKTEFFYAYDSLSALISEQGEEEHRYEYDSLGNRLLKDEFTYQINELNQVLAGEDGAYTFDLKGNLTSKSFHGKTLKFEYDPLGHLISVNDAQRKISFVYDLMGRRLRKKIEVKGKKPKYFRYFYLGQTEIGCVDENNKIIELKVPGDPNAPEVSPAIAIEIKEMPYVPIWDLQGNAECLVDVNRRAIVERYNYSAFGEETIVNEQGSIISKSAIGNFWRFSGKRIDEETGLIYFGLRYYDPSVGRWTSPDPAGSVDGPNLYAYVHNSPISNRDRFGLATESTNTEGFLTYFYGEYEPPCTCEQHRICKRGGDIRSAISLLSPAVSTCCDFFEPRSISYKTGSIKLANGAIGFVNGINNTERTAWQHTQKLSEYAQGAKIHGIFNASHWVPIDVLECALNYFRGSTPPVDLIKREWQHFSSTHGPDAKFLMICHSQGAILVKNALLESPKSMRDKVIVLAIAPAAIIPREFCFDSMNYESDRDFVSYMDIEGNLKYKDQLIVLQHHENAPNWDHNFDSPTYETLIQDQIQYFLNEYGGLR